MSSLRGDGATRSAGASVLMGASLHLTCDGRWLPTLDTAESWERLRSQRVGRLAYTDAVLPAVVPVNFTVVGTDVVIAATPGDKVTAAVRGAVVAFEVDQTDPVTRTGWSVTVVGPARLLADPHLAAQLREDGLVPWAPSPVATYLAVSVQVIAGRRLTEDDDDGQV
ncbi:Pyridoxamine 5'-phosphate oxidase [Quadrisphaera granulorum]|uniref:Pyridoxamine 5'-phosphate oxidase-like protein n=1 Tax=Quadrisphaera granulorum TaxID=317664 RepID=A0A316AG92_9ACTN|nr:pyridoxamine 5'-phosphate oxidase family protein [Quadrisphaera granulorum]PWJ48837.1 pyridoxamine 5'-phosphate oxidase-like protein [Quadrisphaera granulorum]SZE98319.1 Pyridoxamine 5'-phosphate oxidase [Quadrisphaera granulorum]